MEYRNYFISYRCACQHRNYSGHVVVEMDRTFRLCTMDDLDEISVKAKIMVAPVVGCRIEEVEHFTVINWSLMEEPA